MVYTPPGLFFAGSFERARAARVRVGKQPLAIERAAFKGVRPARA